MIASAWREISGEHDIVELMELFGDFHDGCIREIHVASGHSVAADLSMCCDWRTTVHMLVQRQLYGPSAIELKFEEVAELKLSPPRAGYVAVIFAAHLSMQEGMFYWSNDARFDLNSGQQNDYSWMSAKRMSWRDASHWMGATPRYRQEPEQDPA